MNYKLFLSTLFYLAVFKGIASNPNELYTSAQKSFAKGLFHESIKNYELIISECKKTSPDLYHNLGNAYYKSNDLPGAILNYERALKINPGNQDVIYNLSIARSKLKDKYEPIPQIFYLRWFENLRNSLNMNTWASLLILFLFCFCSSLILYFLATNNIRKKVALYSVILAITFSIISFVMARSLYKVYTSSEYAIVFSESLSVKSFPSYNSKGLFIIHAGTKVKLIRKSDDDWISIRTEDGAEGWIPSIEVKPI